jgi:hypothetical protein
MQFHKMAASPRYRLDRGLSGPQNHSVRIGEERNYVAVNKTTDVGLRWEGNIKMDIREIGLEGVDWINLARDRGRWRALVNTANDPSGSTEGGEFD